jgi:6-phosphofructokinase 1
MAAIDSVVEQRWGTMVSLHGTDIVHVGFDAALGNLKSVPKDRYEEAAVLFG